MSDQPATSTFHSLVASGLNCSAVGHARRSGRLDRPFRGVYIPSGELNQRALVHAARLHLGPEAVVVGRSAILLHGIAGLVGATVPEVAMPPGLERRQRTGLTVRFRDIPHHERTEIDGPSVATVMRTLADVLREASRMEAVACVDSALHLGLISPSDVPAVAAMMAGRRGCVSVRMWLLLGYGDMGWRLADGTWLIAEADGREFHDAPTALLYDRRRQNAFLAAARAQIVRFTWEDTGRPGDIDGVIRPILIRGGWAGFTPIRP